MQDLLAELLWDNEEIHHAATELCCSFPGYLEAKREYDEAAKKIRSLVGFELYDLFLTRLNNCNSYEVRAYYSLGLGLRGEILQALGA